MMETAALKMDKIFNMFPNLSWLRYDALVFTHKNWFKVKDVKLLELGANFVSGELDEDTYDLINDIYDCGFYKKLRIYLRFSSEDDADEILGQKTIEIVDKTWALH